MILGSPGAFAEKPDPAAGGQENLLNITRLRVRYGDAVILRDISFALEKGQWMMLVGPNGAGKSTIVNSIAQNAPYTGEILFRGKNVKKYQSKELARKIGILNQNHYVSYAFTVREVVRLGRYAYQKNFFLNGDASGEDAIENALELTGMKELQDHSVLELSGGELQRMFLAQLFAQNPEILVLDEPTNHLDLIYQKQVFELVKRWVGQENRAVISVVHDLSLARAYGTKAVLLRQGSILAQGTTEEVFSKENLRNAYDMDVYAWMHQMLGQWQGK